MLLAMGGSALVSSIKILKRLKGLSIAPQASNKDRRPLAVHAPYVMAIHQISLSMLMVIHPHGYQLRLKTSIKSTFNLYSLPI